MGHALGWNPERWLLYLPPAPEQVTLKSASFLLSLPGL